MYFSIRREDISGSTAAVTIHDPCPLRNQPDELAAARTLLELAGAAVTEPKHSILGFGGKEGKEVRNLLLKNLKGHSAFRTEANKQRWQEARRNEREAARLQAAVEAAGQPEAQLAETVADAILIEQVNQSFEKGME